MAGPLRERGGGKGSAIKKNKFFIGTCFFKLFPGSGREGSYHCGVKMQWLWGNDPIILGL